MAILAEVVSSSSTLMFLLHGVKPCQSRVDRRQDVLLSMRRGAPGTPAAGTKTMEAKDGKNSDHRGL